MSHVMIVGATSAIAEQAARLFAERGDSLFLVARNETALARIAEDLRIRGAARVDFVCADVNEFDKHEELVEQAKNVMNGLDTALIAHGTLGDQAACEADFSEALKELRTNALSVISLCTYIANYMESNGEGDIVVISSVAGDRGRQSNYIYGTAKAAVSTFLSGLRNRLYKSGVHVVDVKPGFVDTPMTADIENKGALWAKPEAIANGIIKAIDKKRNVVYLPFFWWGIMTIIRNIPEFLFKKLSL